MATTQILKDHKRVGQKLISPFNALLGGQLNEISWVAIALPELVWIALVLRQFGIRDGVALITSVARAARAVHPGKASSLFATTSNFTLLSANEKEVLRADLAASGDLLRVQECLEPLVAWYPDCPLRLAFFGSACPPTTQGLDFLKSVLSELYNRQSTEAMMMQATLLHVGFDADAIKIQRGSTLSKFEEIQDYPNTEISRLVGSMVRATLNAMLGEMMPFMTATEWPRYFWNRGLAITPCEFDE